MLESWSGAMANFIMIGFSARPTEEVRSSQGQPDFEILDCCTRFFTKRHSLKNPASSRGGFIIPIQTGSSISFSHDIAPGPAQSDEKSAPSRRDPHVSTGWHTYCME